MKNTGKLLFLVLCMVFMILAGTASAQQCICLDAKGVPYKNNTPGNTLCYQLTATGLVKSKTLTFQKCKEMNAKQGQQQLDLLKQQQEALKKQQEEALKQQQEAIKKHQEEVLKQQEALKKQQEEVLKQQQEALKKQQEEALKKQQEAVKKQQEEAQRLQQEQEALKKQQEEALKKQQEVLKKQQEEALKQQEALKKQQEEARRQQEEELLKLQEDILRKQEEEEALRKQQEEALRQQMEQLLMQQPEQQTNPDVQQMILTLVPTLFPDIPEPQTARIEQILQVGPADVILPGTKINLQWAYLIAEGTHPLDVDFTISMDILDVNTGKTKTTSASMTSSSCSNYVCSYSAAAQLKGLTHAIVTWSVAGTFTDSESQKTIYADNAGMEFGIQINEPKPVPTRTPEPEPVPGPKPSVPILEYPKNRVSSRYLGFYWRPSNNAQSYVVEWQNDKGQQGSMNLDAYDVSCRKGRCTVYATMPGSGNYVWRVTAVNRSGYTSSREAWFEIMPGIPAPRPYRPNGTVFNSTYPSFEWEDIYNGVTEYRVQVVGKYDNIIRMDLWYNANDVRTGSGTCYLQTNLFLPAGSYIWRVQARNGEVCSGWSSWLEFYVECDYCNYNNAYYGNYANTVPTCSYPVGSITTSTPDFQWRTLTGASYYMVTLYDPAGSVLLDSQVSSGNCTAELCRWSPGYTLPKNGNYSWSVSGYGANGLRWGSANGTFTLNAEITLTPLSILRPEQNGYLTDASPVIIWTDPGETTALFHVEIYNNRSVQLFSVDLNREQAWCDGQTCSIEFKSIPDAENYLLTITPYSEMNTAGEMVSLVFSKTSTVLKLNSPQENSIVSSRPLFRWNLDAGTNAQYELILTDANNNVASFSPLFCGGVGVTCEGTEAFFSPADPLAAGTYTAKILAYEAAYRSEETHFTVQ